MVTTMNAMEDSGIDSDPKPPAINIDKIPATITTTTTATTTAVTTTISSSSSSSLSNCSHNERTFLTSDISICSNHQTQQYRQRRCTTGQLQQKLEARIEQAKRIQRSNKEYIEITNGDCNANMILTKSTGLIPIQRLHIPHHDESLMHHERYPLVEYWKSDTADSDDETTIFPLSRNKQNNCNDHKQDLTDTFSIQESSEESEDSLNLITPANHHTSHLHGRNCTPIECCNCPCRII